MDQKCRLNKTELLEIKRLLENFVEEDENIQIKKTFYNMQADMTKKMQNLFEEKMNIKDQILQWFKDNNCTATNYIYYSDGNHNEDKYNDKTYFCNLPWNLGNVTQVLIQTYVYNSCWKFIEENKSAISKLYNDYLDEHLQDLQDRINRYNKIMEEMLIVLNGLKNANAILEKFGFIPNINKYIKKLLDEQAKPISLMTKAVENSVDNYLNSRKMLDEDKK